ncbi:MAG TPA: sulfotransferase [Acidimicrobiales bacterium]|nr:sulfotransferase [Acidimicrobiales bacterium]
MSPTTLSEPVFIVGCPRSGTTLVAARLDSSSELAITPETHFFSHWLRRYPALTTGAREEFEVFWAAFRESNFKWLGLEPSVVYDDLEAGGRWDAEAVFTCLLSSYATVHGKTKVGEKTPTHYRALQTVFEWYPTARALFVVRDPRAVVASYFDLAERVPWARGSAFEVARRWLDASSALERWKGDPRVEVVRYESLVTDPTNELSRLFQWLDMPMQSGPATPTRRRVGAGGLGLQPSADISADSLQRWRRKLRPCDVQVVDRVCGGRMRQLGYRPETPLTAAAMLAVGNQAARTLVTHASKKMGRSKGTYVDLTTRPGCSRMNLVRRPFRWLVSGAGSLRRALRRVRHQPIEGPRPKPWESSVLDDVADARPWNLLLKVTRRWGLLRSRRDVPGAVTVLIVNWETPAETATTLAAVRYFSPPGTQIFVIDNGSRDESAKAFRRADPGSRVLRLPVNVGHPIALDLGTHLAHTEFVVTLDSDAFPLGEGWLMPVTDPFQDPSVVLAGTASKRGFVHPMYSCVRRSVFLQRRLSWQLWRVRDHDIEELEFGKGRFDAGELMTPRLGPGEAVLLSRTPNRVDGLPGMTVADLVYHHGGVTRATQSEGPPSSWDSAVTALLPAEVRSRRN